MEIQNDKTTELVELNAAELANVDGGWYVSLLWGAIEFGSSHN
ncbi:hypothetical protein [Dyadobacter diqingensis]|nr:hypothetical protein [Dyadobacter diqingensis]